MKRRTLLKLLSLSAISPQIIQKSLASEVYDNKFFVVINLPGGWDTTLGLDPWTSSKRPDQADLFLEYNDSETFGNNKLRLGPAAKALSSYIPKLAVVNGIFLSEVDNGHDAAEKYMLTGSTNAQSSMVLNFADGAQISSGLGVITNSSLVRGNSKSSLSAINGISNAYTSRLSGSEFEVFSNGQTHSSALTKALKQMVNNAPNMEKLFKNLDEANYDGNTDYLNSALIVASSFRSNASQFAELKIYPEGEGFDTHSNHEGNHLNSQRSAFEMVKQIFDLFKSTPYGDTGESLFDRTTFMVTSEFSRTSALNNAKGKDHNPMNNSVLLAGNGIKGGQTLGASKLVTREKSQLGLSYQIGMPYDFNSGEVIKERRSGSEFIKPENITRTLCDILDLNINNMLGIKKETAVLHKIMI